MRFPKPVAVFVMPFVTEIDFFFAQRFSTGLFNSRTTYLLAICLSIQGAWYPASHQ